MVKGPVASCKFEWRAGDLTKAYKSKRPGVHHGDNETPRHQELIEETAYSKLVKPVSAFGKLD
jgi:hypothetical protein